MAKVKAYAARPTPLMFEHKEGRRAASALIEFGGWNHSTKVLTPIRVAALMAMPGAPTISWVFDSLAAAAEAGELDAAGYVQQLFASEDDLNAFIDLLNENGDIYWVNDRHYTAMDWLHSNEDQQATYPGIA